jgi:hypothetical protein
MSLIGRSNVNSEDATHIYYDLTITTNDTTGSQPPQRLVFNEIRNNPILMNPSEYFLSVVRFSCDTESLPVFIPQVQLGQIDPNKLVYSVSLTYTIGGILRTAQAFLEYIPSDTTQPIPKPPLTNQDVVLGQYGGSYYFVYSYNHFIKMVNIALQTCFNDLKALAISLGGSLPTNNPPFLRWNNQTNTATLYAEQAYYDNNLVNPINIYFNTPLYTLFSSFEATNYGYFNISQGKNYLINVYNKDNTNISGMFLYMEQEYSTTALFSAVKSLVFSTGLIPVVPTLVSVPTIYGSQSNLLNVGNNSNFNTVLTDFEVENSQYKPSVLYNPQSEYRLLDLISNTPLSSVQISLYWKDKFGNLYPFYLSSGNNCNIKILFRKREFNIPIPKYEM